MNKKIIGGIVLIVLGLFLLYLGADLACLMCSDESTAIGNFVSIVGAIAIIGGLVISIQVIRKK